MTDDTSTPDAADDEPEYAEINGATIAYEVLGAEHDRTVVALHGGPGIGDRRKPRDAFASLAEDYRLVVPDHRGCGQSSPTPPYTNEQFAADVEGLRRHLDLGEVVLVGGSYGGFVTQEYAVRYPEQLAGFVLRDTAATGEYDRQARELARERLPGMRARDLDVPAITEAELDRVMDGQVASDAEFERLFHGMAPLYAPDLDAFDADAAAERIAEMRFHHGTHNAVFSTEFPAMDYTDDLPAIDVPALVTVGRHDWITPVEASEEIADLLPDACLEIFEESGHNPHLDQSEAYLALVREFFEEIGFAP